MATVAPDYPTGKITFRRLLDGPLGVDKWVAAINIGPGSAILYLNEDDLDVLRAALDRRRAG